MININTVKCNLCVVKPPLEKLERNNINIYFFVMIHFIFEAFVLIFILLPEFPLSLSYKILTFLYITLFCVILWNHLYLVFSDPGFLRNTSKLSLLKLVEKNLKVHDYCPVCVVITKMTTDS